jgi:hypothetical protein
VYTLPVVWGRFSENLAFPHSTFPSISSSSSSWQQLARITHILTPAQQGRTPQVWTGDRYGYFHGHKGMAIILHGYLVQLKSFIAKRDISILVIIEKNDVKI